MERLRIHEELQEFSKRKQAIRIDCKSQNAWKVWVILQGSVTHLYRLCRGRALHTALPHINPFFIDGLFERVNVYRDPRSSMNKIQLMLTALRLAASVSTRILGGGSHPYNHSAKGPARTVFPGIISEPHPPPTTTAQSRNGCRSRLLGGTRQR